jgi:hypothetical protein
MKTPSAVNSSAEFGQRFRAIATGIGQRVSDSKATGQCRYDMRRPAGWTPTDVSSTRSTEITEMVEAAEDKAEGEMGS